MAKREVSVKINELLLEQLNEYAAAHGLSVDFVLGVALDQFLSDPENVYTYKDGRTIPVVPR